MRRAYDNGGNGDFHEWRKRVKYLRHQIEVLTPIEPEKLTGVAVGLSDLGDYLGLEHDLTDLEHVVDQEPPSSGREELMATITDRRVQLRAELRPLAENLFAEKPAVFVARLASYWEAWDR